MSVNINDENKNKFNRYKSYFNFPNYYVENVG